MTIRNTLILGAVLALATFAPDASAATRHLICRGEAGNEIRMNSLIDAPGEVGIEWGFEKYTGSKSNIKANGAHLSPGQCSWDTALITEPYMQYIYYHTSASELWFHVSITTDMSHSGESHGTLAYLPSTRDKNLMWLPCFCNAGSKGSIFDPAMIFHFYVSVEDNLFLRLTRTTWAAYPYPGR